jgi:hypothetical protein
MSSTIRASARAWPATAAQSPVYHNRVKKCSEKRITHLHARVITAQQLHEFKVAYNDKVVGFNFQCARVTPDAPVSGSATIQNLTHFAASV